MIFIESSMLATCVPVPAARRSLTVSTLQNMDDFLRSHVRHEVCNAVIRDVLLPFH